MHDKTPISLKSLYSKDSYEKRLKYLKSKDQFSEITKLLNYLSALERFYKTEKDFSRSTNGNTLLHLAAQNNDCRAMLEIFNLLKKHEWNRLLKDLQDDGYTPLITAARNGSQDSVQFLISHGADVNFQGGVHLKTALMCASQDAKKEIVITLLNNNANPNLRSISGMTVVDYMLSSEGYTRKEVYWNTFLYGMISKSDFETNFNNRLIVVILITQLSFSVLARTNISPGLFFKSYDDLSLQTSLCIGLALRFATVGYLYYDRKTLCRIMGLINCLAETLFSGADIER